ncbi:hypothetical protein [Phycicoccus avicenniae]|uniref:hypothetical protein n=1 Tax=Phycicoccus avicenniae TaxID=2828860 RepID=UPI003D2872EF
MSVQRTEVAGLPALHAPRDDDGCTAGLVFRVGGADEHLAIRGVTHLVEHLALHAAGLEPVHERAGLDDVVTGFRASGSPEQVARALSAVCAALRRPPLDALDQVRATLHAEEAARTDGAGRPAAMMRWGAAGRGLASYPEVGLDGLDADVVGIWASAAFTRHNVVLWVSARHVPRGLDLALPDGELPPLPAAPGVLPRTPAWYTAPDTHAVHVTALVPRSPATEVLTHLLRHAVHADALPLGATTTVRCDPHDAGTALLSVLVEGAPETREALAGLVVDAVARLRWGHLGPADRQAVTLAVRDADRPEHDPDLLAARAADQLLGHPTPSRAEHVAALAAVTPDEVRAVAAAVHDSALARVPGGGLDWAGFVPAPAGSTTGVDGREHPVRGGGRAVLVIGPEGVMLRSAAGRSTVRYRELAAVEAFADGGRWLVGLDGFRVHVEPTVYEVGPEDIARIDEAVDPARVVHRAARPPDRLPRPADPGGHHPRRGLAAHLPRFLGRPGRT